MYPRGPSVSSRPAHRRTPDRTIWTHEMLYHPDAFVGEKGQAALAKRFAFTNDVVFDTEDFRVAEQVQAGLRDGGNAYHTLGLEEGLLAVFQDTIDAAVA
ncbi:MAG: SRPBCC family protein [Azospirillaceae bacterium]